MIHYVYIIIIYLWNVYTQDKSSKLMTIKLIDHTRHKHIADAQ